MIDTNKIEKIRTQESIPTSEDGFDGEVITGIVTEDGKRLIAIKYPDGWYFSELSKRTNSKDEKFNIELKNQIKKALLLNPQSSVTVDSSLINGSKNPVKNNAIYDALALKLPLSGSSSISGSLIPAADGTHSLGSASYKWRDVHIAGGTIYIGGIALKEANGKLKIEEDGVEQDDFTEGLYTELITNEVDRIFNSTSSNWHYFSDSGDSGLSTFTETDNMRMIRDASTAWKTKVYLPVPNIIAGKTYRLEYSLSMASISGTWKIGFANDTYDSAGLDVTIFTHGINISPSADFRQDSVASAGATRLAIITTANAAGTAVFDNFSLKEVINITTATTLGYDALPKAGGAMTGAITTSSTFDGVDVDACNTLAVAALPKAGGTMSGHITMPNDGKVIFGDAGEYIVGDGTNLTIKSSGTVSLLGSKLERVYRLTFGTDSVGLGSTVDIVRDEDDMASNDVNALVTQQSVKAYVDNSQYIIMIAGINYNLSAPAQAVIPLGGSTRPLTAFTNSGEYTTFIAPYNGYLKKILFRSEEGSGVSSDDVIIGLHEATTNTEIPSLTAVATQTITQVWADNTTAVFTFPVHTSTALTKGNIYGFTITPDFDINDAIFTFVIKYDVTT